MRAFSAIQAAFCKNRTFPPEQRMPGSSAAEGAGRLSPAEVRVSAERLIAAGAFGTAFGSMATGVVYVAFARAIGVNDFLFGVLAGMLQLAGVLQILAAGLIEKSGQRKRLLLTTGLAGRSLWIVIALLPLLASYFPQFLDPHRVLILVIACIGLSSALQCFINPVFFSLVADLMPARVRPTFLARRIVPATWVALCTAIGSGLIADQWPHLSTYCILLAIAGVCGMVDIACYFGVHEPRPARRGASASISLSEIVRVPLRDAPTRGFLLFTAVMASSNGVAGAFTWLYADEYLHLSRTMTSILLVAIPLLAVVFSMRFWGEVIRRYGTRPVMRLCSFGLALSSLGWLIARPGAWDVLPILFFVSGAMASALDLSAQSLITGLSPHVPRTAMTALYSITAGLSFAFASWCGGALAEELRWINDGHYYLLGLRLVNYHILCLIMVGIRLIGATFIAPLLQEPTAASIVGAAKEVLPEIVESFATRLTKPVKVRK
jgi:MFS family permease